MDVNDDTPSEESNPEMVQVDLDEGMGAHHGGCYYHFFITRFTRCRVVEK